MPAQPSNRLSSSNASSRADASHGSSKGQVAQGRAALAQAGLQFEENRGQADPRVRFLLRDGSQTLFLTADSAWFVSHTQKGSAAGTLGAANIAGSAANAERATSDQSKELYAVQMKIENANPKARITGSGQTQGRVNYFRGNDPAGWETNVPAFSSVVYKEVYRGVDLVYYINQKHQVEYDFRLEAGADPSQIAVRFNGQNKIETAPSGDLIIKTPAGEIRQAPPTVYQQMNGNRQEISSSYVVDKAGLIRFALGKYDSAQALVIDPGISYSTFLGGSLLDQGNAIAIDSSGNAYVTGFASSGNFPTSVGAVQTSKGFLDDVFVTKLNPTGDAIVYSTYLGGNLVDQGNAIAVDSSGNAYITGFTASGNFPTTFGAFQTSRKSLKDTFVAKLDASGSSLLYSTYLGGSLASDQGNGIAIDSSGNTYVTGLTASNQFPTTADVVQASIGGGAGDAYVTKLNSTGTALVYSTYLGGRAADQGNAIAVDSSGNAYVCGGTLSNNFATTAGAVQTSYGGLGDGFVSKLNATGTALVYSTYLGGNLLDSSFGVAVDSDGNAYVTGSATSSTFPTTPGAYQTSYGGLGDAFVTKLNADGTQLVYSTFLGAGGIDAGAAIAVDSAGRAYVSGSTASSSFPTTPGAFQTTYGGLGDAFATRLNSGGTALLYSTFLGAGLVDQGRGIAINQSGDAYVTGNTSSPGFPTTDSAFQTTLNGAENAFVTALPAPDAPTISKAFSPTEIQVNGTSTVTFSISNPNTEIGLTGIAFTDDLPAGLQVAGSPSAATTLGGTVTAAAGATSISFSGGSLDGGGSGTVSVNVIGIESGAWDNTTGIITSDQGREGTTSNTATLAVLGAPTISKAFGSGSVAVGQTTSLTFTLTNPNPTVAVTGAAFTDNMPAGMVVANPANASTTCGGTFAPTPGSSNLSFSGGTIPAGSSCTVSLMIMITSTGTKINQTSALTSANAGSGAPSNTAMTNAITINCLRDNISGNFVQINPQTGDYTFTVCGSNGFTLTGKGTVTKVGSTVNVVDNKSDRRVQIQYLSNSLTGSATITVIKGAGVSQTYRITDTIPNGTCSCGS